MPGILRERRATLIMAATHLGNPLDMPERSLGHLRGADLLIFEEDRPARQFLKLAGITKPYLKYNEHQHEIAAQELQKCLKNGQTALYMSDQGSPGTSDPGWRLVELAQNLGAHVQVIPGPCSVAVAIAACPFPVSRYLYCGYLPRDQSSRHLELEKQLQSPIPVVIIDTPYRRQRLLADLKTSDQKLAIKTRALLALDISGEHEQYLWDHAEGLAQTVKDYPNLNFVLVLPGKNSQDARICSELASEEKAQ